MSGKNFGSGSTPPKKLKISVAEPEPEPERELPGSGLLFRTGSQSRIFV